VVVQLQTRLHAIVAGKLEEGEAFGFARFLVRAVADGCRGDFGEVRADGVRGGCEGEVPWGGWRVLDGRMHVEKVTGETEVTDL